MSHGETFAQALLCRPVMAPIKIKTKTFDGTQEERGWPSSRYDPQRQRSLTDPDNIDLDGGGRSHDQQYQRKRPSLSSSVMLRGEFTESSEPSKTRRRSYNDDLLLDYLNDNHGGGLNDDSNHSNSNTRRKSLPADFHTLETTESQPMLDYGKFFHDTSQSTDLTPSVYAPGQLHQGQEFQQHYNIIQNNIIQKQQQEIERLNSMVKTSTPPTTFSSSDDAPPYSDNFPSSSSSSSSLQQNNVEFVSTLRSMQETLCNLGSTVSTLQDDIAMERITKAFEIVESSARYILSGDSPMAYASLSEAWEIIEYLQTRLSGVASGAATMAEYQTLPQLNMQGVGSMNMEGVGSMSNWQDSQSSLNGVTFPIVHVREKNANGALVCMAVGCSKNAQGRTMATRFAFCRKHHNMYLIQTGQVESWSCECGHQVAVSSDRCGICHRWRRGMKPSMKPSERRMSSTDHSTTSLESMPKQLLDVSSLICDALPPPSDNDPTIIMHRLKKLMEMTQLSHQLLEVRAHVHTTFCEASICIYHTSYAQYYNRVTIYLCIPQRSQAHSETMVQSSRTRLAHLAVLDWGATEETNSGGSKQGSIY
jgi:hypothetical protein